MISKQIKICFDPDGVPKCISMQGASNVIQLMCPLPRELQSIQSGQLAFRLNERKEATYAVLFTTDSTQPVYVDSGVVYVTVWRDLTLCSTLRLQVFGNLPGGGVLPSRVSQALTFDRSLIYDPAVSAPPNILDDLIAKSHWHTNKETLDAIGPPITEADILKILNS